jgi:hypothetical protein
MLAGVQVLVHESYLTSGALDKIQAALQEAGVQVSRAAHRHVSLQLALHPWRLYWASL